MRAASIQVIYEAIGTPGLESYHGTLLYTDSTGQQFYAGGTRSNQSMTADQVNSPSNILTAEAAQVTGGGITSPYGSLITITGTVGDAQQQTLGAGWFSSGNPSQTLLTGTDLSSQWNTIVNAMQQINSQDLPYAPLTQNSNSAWCTAATAAGLSPPLGDAGLSSYWVPGCPNILPTTYAPAGAGQQIQLNSISNPTEVQIAQSSDIGLAADNVTINSTGGLANIAMSTATSEGYLETVYGAGNISVGDGASVDVASGSNITIGGSNLTVNMLQDASAIVTGTGTGSGANTINATSGDTVTNSGSAAIINATGSNLSISDQTVNDFINLTGAGTSATVNGSGLNVDVTGPNSSANVTGGGNKVTLSSNSSDSVSIDGSGTVNGDTGDNLVQLVGNGTDATVYGGGVIGLTGSNETLTDGSNAGYVAINSNETNDTIQGSDLTVDQRSGATGNVDGNNNTIDQVANSGSYVNLDGSGTVNGDTGDNLVQLVGNGTDATVYGGGVIGLTGSNETLTDGSNAGYVAINSNETNDTIQGSDLTVDERAGATLETIDVSDSTITVDPGELAFIDGSDNKIVMANSSNSWVYVDGEYNTVDSTGNSVSLIGDNSVAAVIGSNNIYMSGNNDSLNGDGSADTIHLGSDVIENVHTDNSTIIESSGDTLNLDGDNEETYEQSTSSTIDYGPNSARDFTNNGGPVSVSNSYYPGNEDASDSNNSSHVSYIAYDESLNSQDENNGGDPADTGYVDIGTPADFADTTVNYTGDPNYNYDPMYFNNANDFYEDPLILNLQGTAVQTQGLSSSPATFDMQSNGEQVRTGWGKAGEGYLVYDPNNTNDVTEASDLVGGFSALEQLDSNGDGVFNASDAAWVDTKVWVDSTGTGSFTAGSLYSLDQLGITSINLNAANVNTNSNGNIIVDDSTFTWANGSTGDIAGASLMFNPTAINPSTTSITPQDNTVAVSQPHAATA